MFKEKQLNEYKILRHEDRIIRYVNFTTLETRRLRGDSIDVFKIFKGFDDVDPSHSLKLIKPRRRLDIRTFSVAHRVIDIGIVKMRVLSHVTQLTPTTYWQSVRLNENKNILQVNSEFHSFVVRKINMFTFIESVSAMIDRLFDAFVFISALNNRASRRARSTVNRNTISVSSRYS